jgi:predicted ATP-dependent endonuclease of OLD family
MSETPPQAYISKVHLKGYKSIRDLEIDFKPGLNIIIGPNGSGKTNFLEFLKIICSDFVNQPFELIPFQAKIDFINRDQDYISSHLTTKFKIANSKYRFIIEDESYLNKKKFEKNILLFSETGNYQEEQSELFVPLDDEFKKYKILKPDLTLINYGNSYDERLRTPLQVTFRRHENVWHITGKDYNVLFGLVHYIYRASYHTVEEYISVFFNLEEDFKTLLQKFSPIKDIKFNESKFFLTQINEHEYKLDNITLSFYVNDRWDYWQNLSDGTKRMFYIIATFYKDYYSSSIFLLEEPELGIHPDQLYKLMDFLKEQSKEKQIIITTHSPEVLNILEKDEIDRIIVTRHEGEKGTKMYHLSEKEQSHVRNYMKHEASISDYWLQSGFEKENEEEVAS